MKKKTTKKLSEQLKYDWDKFISFWGDLGEPGFIQSRSYASRYSGEFLAYRDSCRLIAFAQFFKIQTEEGKQKQVRILVNSSLGRPRLCSTMLRKAIETWNKSEDCFFEVYYYDFED
jgi:hypothetical protein